MTERDIRQASEDGVLYVRSAHGGRVCRRNHNPQAEYSADGYSRGWVGTDNRCWHDSEDYYPVTIEDHSIRD